MSKHIARTFTQTEVARDFAQTASLNWLQTLGINPSKWPNL